MGNEPDAYIFQPFDISNYTTELQVGDNVLAIHGLNNGTTSSDLLFVPRLEITADENLTLSSAAILSSATPDAVNAALRMKERSKFRKHIHHVDFIQTPSALC